jgi:multiple sugar transport system substrate-binding protein
MNKKLVAFGALGLTITAGLIAGVGQAQQKTTLKVFFGSQLRPDVIGPIFLKFQKANPDISVQIETGGATSELQNQYLSTVLTAKDSSLDVFLIDIIRPAQYQAQGWIEPLDSYFGGSSKSKDFLDGFLPGPIEGDTVDGKLMALPAFTDSQFLYYRKDLLAKYNLKVPKTWEEMTQAAQTVQKGENDPNLQGFNFQGAPIEGAVCTFLQPLWGAGGQFSTGGKVTVDSPASRKSMGFLVDTINKLGITPKSMAEVKTDDSRKQMQAGQVVFGLNWSYAWAHFQGNSPDPTKVKGNIGVARVPTFAGSSETRTNCVGGWQWALSAYGKQKEAAFKLIKYMAGPDAQAELAIKAGNAPVRKSLYNNGAVLKANPHFAELYPVIVKARSRPVSANYAKVSEIIRTNLNAMVAGAKTVGQGLKDMQADLEKVVK